MTIKEIQVVPFSLPYREPFVMSTGAIHFAENVLVILVPDKGPIGLGETQPVAAMRGCGETQHSVVQIISKVYIPMLLNRDPSELTKISEDLDSAVDSCPYALAAVMDALYDLLAKSFHIPLYKLLGGLYRNKIEMVWPIGIKAAEDLDHEVKTAMNRNYRKIKLKVGSADPIQDIDNIRRVRHLLDDEASLRIDANTAYSFSQAAQVIRALRNSHLDIFEQPLAMWDYTGLARLANMTDMQIMADESCSSVRTALELIRTQAASIFDLKLPKNGGIHFARTIANIAGAVNIPVYPGSNPSSSIGTGAAMHLFASLNNCLAGDFNVGQAKSLSGDIAKTAIAVDEPFAFVPEGEGIGVELDEKKLSKYEVAVA